MGGTTSKLSKTGKQTVPTKKYLSDVLKKLENEEKSNKDEIQK